MYTHCTAYCECCVWEVNERSIHPRTGLFTLFICTHIMAAFLKGSDVCESSDSLGLDLLTCCIHVVPNEQGQIVKFKEKSWRKFLSCCIRWANITHTVEATVLEVVVARLAAKTSRWHRQDAHNKGRLWLPSGLLPKVLSCWKAPQSRDKKEGTWGEWR